MKRKVVKQWLSIILAVIMIFSSSASDFSGVINTYAADDKAAAESKETASLDTASDYGLADRVEDGVILHAWNWSFNQIKSELKNIAEAGYTAVQTSPVQPNKEGSNVSNTSAWWKFYQPLDFTVCENSYGNINKLGTKAEFTALCTEAHKYGIKIVVDVVSNHLANKNSGKNTRDERCPSIPSYLKDNDAFWHMNGYTQSSDGDRSVMTVAPIGMPDLNTGNTELQKIITDFLSDAQKCGADGFRFDAAKHIETPTDDASFRSDFWKRVKEVTTANNPDVFLYGEILNTAGPGNYSDVQKYTPYIRVTNNKYANNLRSAIGSRNADGAKFTNNEIFGSNGNEWVLWNESHDTYAGEYGEQSDANFDDEEMALAWCVVASRTSPALYFSRPVAGKGDGIWASAALGAHTDMYKDSRIAAMNKFHNYFAGQAEYVTTSNNVLVTERGTTGVALVNFNRGAKSVSIPMNKMVDGTYTDQVTGKDFTVTNGTLTGNIGSGGVAVIYNAKPIPKEPTPTISKEGGDFSDTLTLTLGLRNATSGTYQIGDAKAVTYTSSTQITIGSDMNSGDSVTITLTATDGTSTSEAVSYTFTKVDKIVNKAYIALPSGWSEPVYCYAYDSATEATHNADWPGVKMTRDAATGYYVYEVPENIVKPRVIFYSSDTNRYPADMQKGLLFDTDGSWLYKDGNWAKYTPPVTEGKVTVKYVDTEGKTVAASKTLKGTIGTAYTTQAAEVTGYTLKTTPQNATGKYTKEDITVTYVYEAVVDDSIKITSSLADGTTFDTETKTITLTITNAVSGTYSVDNGPVKKFTGSADVIIGQGKIADSVVTVDVTATNGTDTVKKTFTYNKKFNGKVANETLSAASALPVSLELSKASSKLPSQYSTNGTGFGKEATITIDGSISDWNESMLIAQNVAWDVPNHWKGTHENCVIDDYALYAAYDDDNLYIGVQMVNIADTIYYNGCGALLDGGVPGDVPLIIALDTGKGNKMTGEVMDNGAKGYIWGAAVDFNKKADHLLYMSCKPGLGTPSIFKAGTDGVSDYTNTDLCISFKNAGIEYDVAHDCLPDKLIGLNHNEGKIEDLLDENGPWVDYMTFTDNEGTKHSSQYDSFFEVKIPYSVLGITKSDITSNGVGVLSVGTRGESGLDCIPYDYDAMTDNIMGDYASDASTSAEKDDTDILTVDYARVGKESGNPTPDPDPDPTPDLTVNFGADRSSPQLNTTELTLKGIASGGTAPYTYEFFVDGASVQDASAADTYTWKPAAGNHTIKVTVTDAKGASVSSQKTYVIEGNPEDDVKVLSVSSLKADKESVKAGETVNLTAEAVNGEGTLQYKFTAKNENGETSVISDFSAKNTVSWTPAKGVYTVEVTVKDEKGSQAKKSVSGFIVTSGTTPVTALKINSFNVDKESGTAVVGDVVSLSAEAEGTGELKYRFTYTTISDDADGDVIEEEIQGYSTSSVCSWTTPEADHYTLTVYVEDNEGNIVKKSIENYIVNAKTNSEITIDSFTPDKASGTAKVNEAIQLSAKVTANVPVTYKFTAVSGGKETVISDYSDKNSVTWKPQTAGKYQLYVYVRDANAFTVNKVIEDYVVNAADEEQSSEEQSSEEQSSEEQSSEEQSSEEQSSEDQSSEDLTGSERVRIKSIKFNKATNTVTSGQTVKITATATGGKGDLLYKFKVQLTNKKTTYTRSYSDINTCNWTPSKAGKYVIYVYVTDDTGKVVNKTYKYFNVKSPLRVKKFSLSKKSGKINAGTSVNIKAHAVNGIGEKFYKYYYKYNGKKYTIKNYTEKENIKWTPKKAGKYTMYVQATDDMGNKVTATIKNYVVNGKLKVNSLKPDKSSVKAGTAVKLKTAVKGGLKKYKYKYQYVYKGKKGTIRNYSTSANVKWTPKNSGKYEITVTVKDATGQIVKKTIKYNVK